MGSLAANRSATPRAERRQRLESVRLRHRLEYAAAAGALVATEGSPAARARDALLAWHASFGKSDPEAKPRQVLDIADARKSLLVIAKIVETIERIRTTVTLHDVNRMMETSFSTAVSSCSLWDGRKRLQTISRKRPVWGSRMQRPICNLRSPERRRQAPSSFLVVHPREVK